MITITPATDDSVLALVALLEEMDAFYGDATEGSVETRKAQLHAVLFAERPKASVLLAIDNGQVLGIASYSFLWPAAGVSASLYLKELYVRQDVRRSGIGKLLMRALVDIAVREGCSRVEWTTDRSNEAAQRFYASLGHQVNTDKLFYRLALPN